MSLSNKFWIGSLLYQMLYDKRDFKAWEARKSRIDAAERNNQKGLTQQSPC